MLIYPTILKLGRNDSGPKRPRAETTHLPRPKRPTPKIGQNDLSRNDPAETTRNPPEGKSPHLWDPIPSSKNRPILEMIGKNNVDGSISPENVYSSLKLIS